MPHGENAQKNGHNREYWSRRPCSGFGWGSPFKEMTHRRERRAATRLVHGVSVSAIQEDQIDDQRYLELVANDNGAPEFDEGADG